MSAPAAAMKEERPGFSAWFMVFVLTLAYTASFIDRQVLNLLVEPIKADYGLDDTRLSLLQGIAFTGAYVLMSPLFGRLADTGSRRSVLTFGIILWSAGTCLCGLARNYWQLFAARFGVGGAEACLTPAAWSIIADSFPQRMIPRALSILMMGPYLGGGLALIFGGLLLESAAGWDLSAVPVVGDLKPWQLVFVAAGLPGLLIAGLFLFIREPARRLSAVEAGQERMPLSEVWQIFRKNGAFYGNFYAGMSSVVIMLYAVPAWMPTVLIRRFGASAGEVGVQYGAAVLVTGSVGVLCGPWLARLLEPRVRGHLMVVPLIAAVALVGVSVALGLAGSYGAALGAATVASFFYSLPQSLASTALQLATPNRMRGVASALYVFFVSVTGLGLAPTIVALLTDHVFRDEMRVGDSLAITCLCAALAGTFFLWRALVAYRAIGSRA